MPNVVCTARCDTVCDGLQAIMEDLAESRKAQQAARVVQQAGMAEQEQADFERILRANWEKAAQEAQLAAQARFPLAFAMVPTLVCFAGHACCAGGAACLQPFCRADLMHAAVMSHMHR